jgi:hypothetical protein
VKGARLRTLAVAALTLAAVVGAAFALQAGALGRESMDAVLVVKMVGRLEVYRGSQAAITLQGRRLNAVCVQTWRSGKRDATVRVAGGPTLRELGNKLVSTTPLAVDEFELAGCPHALAKYLVSLLNRGLPIVVSPTRVDGLKLDAVWFRGAALKLRIYVTRRGGFPVALGIHGGGLWGTSEVRFGLLAGGTGL